MTTEAATQLSPEEQLLAQVGEQFAGNVEGQKDVFAREERRFIGRTEKMEMAFMPEDVLERSQIDYKSDAFKAAYPHGLAALHIVVKGVDVKFTGVPDEALHLWIPLFGDRPENYGKPKGRRSKAHVISEAFEAVYKRRPYGAENHRFLTGQVAEWGQHLGEATIEGDKREWGWDIPRRALPADYKHEGPVREIPIGRRDEGGAASVAGVAEMSDDEAFEAMVAAVTGLEATERDEASTRILNIQGLPQKFTTAAIDGTILRVLGENKKIEAVDNKIVRHRDFAQATAA